MAKIITKMGDPKNPPPPPMDYRGTCHVCGTEFECTKDDVDADKETKCPLYNWDDKGCSGRYVKMKRINQWYTPIVRAFAVKATTTPNESLPIPHNGESK